MENKEENRIDLEAAINAHSKRKVPRFVLRYMKKIVHEQEMNDFIFDPKTPTGKDFFQASLDFLGMKYKIKGAQNMPSADHPVIFACTHPLGGPESLLLGAYLVERYGEAFQVPVNSLLSFMKPLTKFFVPVNVLGGRQTRDIGARMAKMFETKMHVLVFPSGKCARKKGHMVVEEPWKKMFITQAKRYHRDVVPVHCSGHNSRRFYILSRISDFLGLKINLGMFYLADELFKQKGNTITLTFGEPVSWETFDTSKKDIEWAAFVREKAIHLPEIIKE